MAAPVAADVPHKYDVLINGTGFLLADMEDVKAQYGYTPTFVPRSNTQGDFGDNFQDFWLTETQRDWTGGEQQRFYRPRLAEASASRYWDGTFVDRSIPGQVSMRKVTSTLSFAASIVGAIGQGGAGTKIFAGSSTNLYEVAADGTITDRGAHGAGTFASKEALAVDSSTNVYIGGATKVRRYDTGATTFSDFSATVTFALCYLNNTLYAITNNLASLSRFDGAGTETVIFTWNSATTGLTQGTRAQLCAYGSKLLIARISGDRGAELWLYDGSAAPTRIAVFPPNFTLNQLEVVDGVAYVGGNFAVSTTVSRPAVYYYANGTYGLLWKAGADAASFTYAPIAAFGGGLVIADESEGTLLFYDPVVGGVSSLGSYSVTGGLAQRLTASAVSLMMSKGTSTGYLYYPAGTTATSSTVVSSLMDFDSSLTKVMRGIKVEFDSASDGNGGSVDIAYRVGDLEGAYTTLQTGAVSGTEYLLSGVTGRSISVKVTLNKGTSTNGPVLKRVSVRAVPQQTTFRKETFVINCTGRDGVHPLVLRNGEKEANDGLTLATALRTAATSSNPISITDEFGTFTGVIEADGFSLRRVRPNEFIAIVPVREV
jgi:hypothetical protein